MKRGIADTSIFIAQENKRAINENSLPEEIAVSVITIGELYAGVLAATDLNKKSQRLLTLSQALNLSPIPIEYKVTHQWAKLRILLRDSGQKMGVNDSWIAATAMALEIPVITQDQGYVSLDELEVIYV